MTKFDESYVREILASAPAGLAPEQFLAHCRRDLDAGYAAEFEEARRRYFAAEVTPTMRRALAAVEAGEVSRVYKGDGNAFKPPAGIGAATLRKLEALRWIDDDHGSARGGMRITCGVILTKKGAAALAAARAADG